MITWQRATASGWYAHLVKYVAELIKEPRECQAVTQRLLAHYLDYDLTKHLLNQELKASKATLYQLNDALARLKGDEPIQYILGSAPFLAYTLQVTPHVLIPRPETEEMVDTILKRDDLRGKQILDLCTGSGCIAIALKKEVPEASVEAVDISEQALAVAQSNAIALGAEIRWHHLDLLQDDLPTKSWDLIVSNPPYIPFSERQTMARHVVEHEPALALFVEDKAPYRFYERIAALSATYLHPEGNLYVEFHAPFANEVEALFHAYGFGKVHIYNDLQGKKRFLQAAR